MVQGTKRTGPAEPQSKAKKTRATPKKVQIQEQPAEPSPNGGSPTIVGEGTEAASSEIGSQDYGKVRNVLETLQADQKKLDLWPAEFGQKVDEKEADVVRSLNDVRLKLNNDKSNFESSIIPLFESALGPINAAECHNVDDSPIIHIPFTTTKNQAFIGNLESLLKSCHRLTDTYHTLANITPPTSSMPKLEEDLRLDKEAIDRSIAAGRKVVQSDIEGMLADRYNEVRGRRDLTQEDETRGRALMARAKQDGEMKSENMGWGDVAYDVERVAKKMEGVGLVRKERRER